MTLTPPLLRDYVNNFTILLTKSRKCGNIDLDTSDAILYVTPFRKLACPERESLQLCSTFKTLDSRLNATSEVT